MNGDNTKEIKIVENGLVIIVLFAILIIVTPYFISVINTSWKKSAEVSTKGMIETIKELYISINLIDEVNLPFKMVYKNKKYTLYSDNNKYVPLRQTKVKLNGKAPSEGTIEIKNDGNVVVKNLRFGLYKCNTKENETIVCKI